MVFRTAPWPGVLRVLLLRSDSVSRPWTNSQELKGLSAAPMSRSSVTRTFRMKATLPCPARCERPSSGCRGTRVRFRELGTCRVPNELPESTITPPIEVPWPPMTWWPSWRGCRRRIDGTHQADADGIVDDQRDAGRAQSGPVLEVGTSSLGCRCLGVDGAGLRGDGAPEPSRSCEPTNFTVRPSLGNVWWNNW